MIDGVYVGVKTVTVITGHRCSFSTFYWPSHMEMVIDRNKNGNGKKYRNENGNGFAVILIVSVFTVLLWKLAFLIIW